jgi:putative ABC transport system permease protein
VGRSFLLGRAKTPHRVVGIAGEIRNPSLDPRVDPPEIYIPLVVDRNGEVEASAFASGEIHLALRCAAGCPELPAVRQAVRDVSAEVVINSLGPMADAYRQKLAEPRAAAALSATFAVVALLASAVGVFGVLSAAVAARRREFGIRVALGVDPARLRRTIMIDATRLAIAGLALGCFGAWALGRSLAALTYEVQPTDVRSWIAVCGSLGLALLAAAWRPASQAARVDPVKLLRDE